MTTISRDNQLVTIINIFTVNPADQERLISLLTEATQSSVQHAKGFVSATLHRSLDGTKVAMYAQWRSLNDYQAMREDKTPLPFLLQALSFSGFDPGIYEIVENFDYSNSA